MLHCTLGLNTWKSRNVTCGIGLVECFYLDNCRRNSCAVLVRGCVSGVARHYQLFCPPLTTNKFESRLRPETRLFVTCFLNTTSLLLSAFQVKGVRAVRDREEKNAGCRASWMASRRGAGGAKMPCLVRSFGRERSHEMLHEGSWKWICLSLCGTSRIRSLS